MIIDDITDCLIQRTLDDGGEVWAFNATNKFKVISAGNNQVTIESQGYEFGVGDKLSFLYLPKYSTPYCNPYKDTDGDGIIDLVDLDKDGDGVIDPRAPFRPSFVYVLEILPTIAPSQVTIAISPNPVLVTKAREWGKPLVIDGYYPLYISEGEALWASPMAEPLAHPHNMSEEHDGVVYQWQYWMPHGVNQWHGDYTNCPPDNLFEVFASSVETYDFEYVDRISGRSFFASIIPYDYSNRLLGIDRDENGTYESQQSYFLENMYNSQDTFNESGQLLTNGDFKWSHYSTNPRQAWTFEVTSKATSEDTLPDGHSFQMGNYVYHIRTYSKFSPETEDARKHTLSWAIYHSKLTNGSNAEFSAQSGGVVVYNQTDGNGGDYWAKKAPLEINSDGFIVMDDDMFSEGDRFYIIEQYVPEAPSFVLAEGPTLPDAIQFVFAQLYLVKPNRLLIVNASVLDVPLAPTVEANIYAQEQEILWTQFESGTTTGEKPLDDVVEEEEKVVEWTVNRLLDYDPTYQLVAPSGNATFIAIDPFETRTKSPCPWQGRHLTEGGTFQDAQLDGGSDGWFELNNKFVYQQEYRPEGQWTPLYMTQQMYLQREVVSQGLFKDIMGSSVVCSFNEDNTGDQLPAHNISYQEAYEFCVNLNRNQRARGNLRGKWMYMLPNPVVLNRYLGQDFSGSSYYTNESPRGSIPSQQSNNALGLGDIDSVRAVLDAYGVLPPQEVTEDNTRDFIDSIKYAPWGNNHVNVNTGYTNRYGFINPFGSVETYMGNGSDMSHILKSSGYLGDNWADQNRIFNKVYGGTHWNESPHPQRVADWNYKYNFGGALAWNIRDYRSLNGQFDIVNPSPTYYSTWGLAKNAQVRVWEDDPHFGEVIQGRNYVWHLQTGVQNAVYFKTDPLDSQYMRSYWSLLEASKAEHHLVNHNNHYFEEGYDIPADFDGRGEIGATEPLDTDHYDNYLDWNRDRYKKRPKAGLRLMLVNFNSGYLQQMGYPDEGHDQVWEYYN